MSTSPSSSPAPVDFLRDLFGLSPPKIPRDKVLMELESRLLEAIDGIQGRGK